MNICNFKSNEPSGIPDLKYSEASELQLAILNLEHNKKVVMEKYPAEFNKLNTGGTGYITLDKFKFDKYIRAIIMHNLTHHTFARLFKSAYGVGVVAIRDIPSNTSVFDSTYGECIDYKPTFFTEQQIRRYFRDDPANGETIISFLKDFYLSSVNNTIVFPINLLGPNMMDISFYLNHSDTPNLRIAYLDNCDMTSYESIRDIKQGEELTIDYRHFDLPKSVLYDYMPFLKSNTNKNSQGQAQGFAPATGSGKQKVRRRISPKTR